MAPWSLFKKKKPDLSKPSEILDDGWQFYSKPNNIEKPGTIFRIDKDNVKYIVTHLVINTDEGEEAFGKSSQQVAINIGFFANILGISKLNVNAAAKVDNNFLLEFELVNARRESTTDDELKKVLDPYLKKMEFRADQRYFITRETRKGSGIVYKLNKQIASQFGGEAEIENVVSLKGNFVKVSKGKDFELVGKFETPLRVMFLPEEIKPVSLNFAGDNLELGIVPVKECLYWEEAGVF